MNSNPTRLTALLVASLIVTALIAGFSVYRRNQVEVSNRATSLAADYESVEFLSAGQGLTVDQALVNLKAQGLNALILPEETLTELIGQGRVQIATSTFDKTNPRGGLSDHPNPGKVTTITLLDRSVLPRIQQGLRIRFHNLVGDLQPRGNVLVLPPLSPTLLRSTTVGLSPEQAGLAIKYGMTIIARCGNPAGINSKTVEETLTWAHDLGATVFLPQGDQVLGRRDALATTVETLRGLNMLYATPEFSKIGGDSNVVEDAPEIVLRLHSALAAELDKLSFADAIERYAKASRERNMRVLLVRPFTFGAPQPLSSYGLFLKSIGDQIRHEGGEIGVAKPYTEPSLPRFIFPLLGLAIAAVLAVTLSTFTSGKFLAAWSAVLALIGLACWVKSGQQIMAFLAATSFPLVGFLLYDQLRPRIAASSWVQIFVGYIVISAVSLLGGLCVAGMLNGLPYYIKAEEFRGIKASVFFPILLVGGYYQFRLTDWKATYKSPMTWGGTAMGVLIIAALGFMLARTGNDTGASASGGEIVFRNFLDNVLYVRPRTKEFLIGHPLLFVGLGLLARHSRKNVDRADSSISGWAVLALAVGALGQTSIVNTLCHVHIPVMLSMVRVLLGLGFGAIFGCILWAAMGPFVPKRLPLAEVS